MIAGAAVFADAAAAHALNDQIIGHFQRHHSIESDSRLFQHLRLRNGAGYAVQDKSIGTVGFLQTFFDDADNDIVRYQLAGIHVLLGSYANRSTIFDGGTQNVTSGDRGDPQLLLDNVCLCALTGTRSA